MISKNDYAERRAWEWILIAITRPIDTLIISLYDLESSIAKVLLELAKENSDIIEVKE